LAKIVPSHQQNQQLGACPYRQHVKHKLGVLARFSIIIGEFHWLERIKLEEGFNEALQAFAVLTANHSVTHIHVNNCASIRRVEGVVIPEVIEVTFLRKDRTYFDPSFRTHNNPWAPEIILSPFW